MKSSWGVEELLVDTAPACVVAEECVSAKARVFLQTRATDFDIVLGHVFTAKFLGSSRINFSESFS